MSEELEKLEKQIEEKISNANNLEHLNSIKIEVFGKKGLITNHLKLLSGLSENERKIKGKVINDIKNKINQLLQEKNKTLNDNEISKKLEKEEIDITLSPRPFDEGKLNPITQTIAEVTTIFQKTALSRTIRDLRTCDPGAKKSLNFLKNRFLGSESIFELFMAHRGSLDY